MYNIIDKLERDDGLYWELSDENAIKLFMYAGYTDHDDLVKLCNNIRSEERYQEYVERQKRNSFLGRLKSKVGEIIGLE